MVGLGYRVRIKVRVGLELGPGLIRDMPGVNNATLPPQTLPIPTKKQKRTKKMSRFSRFIAGTLRSRLGEGGVRGTRQC